MNGTENGKSGQTGGRDKDVLDELFRHVSARQRPPEEDERAIRAALHEQWQEMTRQGLRRRNAWLWGLAASLTLALIIGNQVRLAGNAPPVPEYFAQAKQVLGVVTKATGDETGSLPVTERELFRAGQVLRTNAGAGLSLTWGDGVVVSIDERSELRLMSDREAFLSGGRIYLDAPPTSKGEGVTIATRQGLVRHLGTQFMTAISASGLTVSVREGEVAYVATANSGAEPVLAAVGQRLSVSAGGAVERSEIQTWGEDWEWTEKLTAGFESDGRSLAELLSWAGRESGREVVYESANAKAMAESTVLHGHLELEPSQALSVVSASSDLQARAENGAIVVGLQPPE